MDRYGAELGNEIDKVVELAEVYQLPAPLIEAPENSTRATIFAQKPLTAMDNTERVRACYQHACLRYVMKLSLNKASFRERFGIADRNAAQTTRLLNESVDSDLVISQNPDVGTRSRTYLPYWAG